ncbi:MAG: MFS transporter [Halobacteria archaeon]|nr:MFS transporter [Halobacteria archaeon]
MTDRRLALVVYLLVTSAFANIYVTQPVLPVIANDLGVSPGTASLTVSAIIAGFALANIPWGIWADHHRIQPIILIGSLLVGLAGVAAASIDNLYVLTGARFVQGLGLPALLTCVAAYLGRFLAAHRLNVVMGGYVAATVTGGIFSRLLSGWFFPEGAWRLAMLFAAMLTLGAGLLAVRLLHDEGHDVVHKSSVSGYSGLLRNADLLRLFFIGFTGFMVFQTVINYLPFRLVESPLHVSVKGITAVYLAYAVGIVMAPLSGAISNRLGNATTVLLGSVGIATGIALTTIDSVLVITLGILTLCSGFFALHSAAVGAINRMLAHGKGRANALYVLFYYCGGFAGISFGGVIYKQWGWSILMTMLLLVVAVPAAIAVFDRRRAAEIGSS